MRLLLLLGVLLCFALPVPSSAYYDDCPAVGSVSRLDQAQGALAEEPPTPSPSTAPACESQTSNARGRYSSTMAPCTFTFHSIQDTLEPSRWIDFETSSLCSEENGFLVIKEYVSNWRDECVGDYSRCYSLEHHRNILFDFLCGIHVELPPETTHLSVDCIEDKERWLEVQEARNEQRHEKNEDKLQSFELKLFNMMLIMSCCLGGIFLISKVLVEPLVTQGSQNMEAQRECPEHGNGCDQGWVGSRRVHLEIEGSPDGEDGEARMLEEFERQIPADFDAIPIVPATLVTDDGSP